MNELFFFLHLTLIFLCTVASLRLGREALIGWIVLSSMLANLFVLKQITLFSFQATCTDAYILGIMLGLNLLQEHYGASIAKRTTYYSFGAMVLFILLSKMHLFYLPAMSDWAHPSYDTILSHSPRILFASLATFFLVQQLDVRLFAFLKNKFGKLHLIFRTTVCLVLSQAIDTALFTFLGLYGLTDHILSLIFVSFCVKATIALCSAPFTALSKKFKAA
jgi:uncharacterized integral membrane protein (TIGR00697 family)